MANQVSLYEQFCNLASTEENEKVNSNTEELKSFYTEASVKESRRNLKTDLRTAFLYEGMYAILDKSLGFTDRYNEPIKKVIISNYINESGGVDSIMNRIKEKTLFLSEFAKIVDKYTNKVFEEAKTNPDEVEIIIKNNDKENFYNELKDTEFDDITNKIRERVENSISEFIDKNIENKTKIEDIITKAKELKDKVVPEEYSDEAIEQSQKIKESYDDIANKQINKVRNSSKPIFMHFVEHVSKEAFNNPEVFTECVQEGKLNMDEIINKAKILHTMLEMLNTAQFENINAEFLKETFESL
jgi:hypothetical protein